MKKIIFTLLFLVYLSSIFAQNTFTAHVKDEKTKKALAYTNVAIKDTNIGASADSSGKVIIKNIHNGKQTLIFSYVGYRHKEKTFLFPLKTTAPIIIYLEQSEQLKVVTVTYTRTYSRIENIPTRVEVLGNEEVVEETGINPGNISKLLGETSGIFVQHTSAVSGNVSFRIQGLPGKYTQLLKDGFPTYGGFASGLSLLQIPPLDLKQVEIIKGSASTLYGGDAIAGIIDLVAKEPTDKQQFSILLNQTDKGGRDLSSYYSGKNKNLGFTLLTGFNNQKAKDINGNNFTDIPQYDRAVVNPRIFWTINSKNKLTVGLNASYENRLGGDIYVLQNDTANQHNFHENNQTKYLSANLKFVHHFNKKDNLSLRINQNNFQRKLKTNTNYFQGTQNTLFSEISYLKSTEKYNWVSGLNFYSDIFNQSSKNSFLLNYSEQTIGIFTQDTWKTSKKLSIEPGFRYDYSLKYGSFALPRLAVMYKISKQFSSRLSGGLGYKVPTPFTDEAERTRYQNIHFNTKLQTEKSASINLDFTLKTPLFDALFLVANQAFFAVQIQNPIIANFDSLLNQTVYFQNADGILLNKGMNTNIRLSLDELILYVDYTYLNARKQYNSNKILELTPQNRLTITLAYEDEKKGWKIGLEAFYFGNQYLEEGTKTPDYWLLGASAQKTIGHFTLAVNIENILDIRQTRYEKIYTGNIANPNFNELYSPLNGREANIVLKFDLF